MRRRRHTLDEPSLEIMIAAWDTLDRAHAGYAELLDLYERDGSLPADDRQDALNGAHGLALMAVGMQRAVAGHQVDEHLMGRWIPTGLWAAFASLGYALGALAEGDPEPEALLSRVEIEHLYDKFRLGEWAGMMRDKAVKPLSES
jgi:hypothetical protein